MLTESKQRFYVCINGHRESWHGDPVDLAGPLPTTATGLNALTYECAVEDCHAEAEPVALHPEGGTCDYCGYDITVDGRGHDTACAVKEMQEASDG